VDNPLVASDLNVSAKQSIANPNQWIIPMYGYAKYSNQFPPMIQTLDMDPFMGNDKSPVLRI
jgi:hypothetical protein